MKFAFLIIAHNDFSILKKTIELLDNINNDIYVHFDKKVNQNEWKKINISTNQASLKIYCKYKVNWGSFSIVKCELFLLEESTKTYHDYYHLISGCDMPLKSNLYFQKFFSENRGKEFIFLTNEQINTACMDWIDYYYFFQEYCKSSNYKALNLCFQAVNFAVIKAQIYFHIKRKHKFPVFQKGSQWFSISDELARFVVLEKDKITHDFKFSYCADEIFIQTVVINSKFKNLLYSYKYNDIEMNMRLIDWKRGKPYIFVENDYEEIITANCLFARKFSTTVDIKIVNKLADGIVSNE